MERDAIVGVAVLVGALGLLVALVVWSRLRIGRIARNGYRSAREIEKDLNGGG